jgi:hypothetical protein
MLEEENQLGLFELAGTAPELRIPPPGQTPPYSAHPVPAPPAKPAHPVATPPAKSARPAPVKPAPLPPAQSTGARSAPPAAPAPAVRKVSGLVPDGDVRLTANIRQDLHLKLKIASAHRRTTIGEILEEMIEKCL